MVQGWDIAIIGAGLGGLVAGAFLEQRGCTIPPEHEPEGSEKFRS